MKDDKAVLDIKFDVKEKNQFAGMVPNFSPRIQIMKKKMFGCFISGSKMFYRSQDVFFASIDLIFAWRLWEYLQPLFHESRGKSWYLSSGTRNLATLFDTDR